MKPPRNERESRAELVSRIERESDAAPRMVGRPRVTRKRPPIWKDGAWSFCLGSVLGSAISVALFLAMTRGA